MNERKNTKGGLRMYRLTHEPNTKSNSGRSFAGAGEGGRANNGGCDVVRRNRLAERSKVVGVGKMARRVFSLPIDRGIFRWPAQARRNAGTTNTRVATLCCACAVDLRDLEIIKCSGVGVMVAVGQSGKPRVSSSPRRRIA